MNRTISRDGRRSLLDVSPSGRWLGLWSMELLGHDTYSSLASVDEHKSLGRGCFHLRGTGANAAKRYRFLHMVGMRRVGVHYPRRSKLGEDAEGSVWHSGCIQRH